MRIFYNKLISQKSFLLLLISFYFFLTFNIFTSCSSLIFPEFKITNYSYSEKYIKLEFSEIPDIITINKATTLIKNNFSEQCIIQQNEKTIYIFPSEPITKNEDYSLVITTEAEDINGVSLISNFKWNFSTKDSDLKPEILETAIKDSSLTIKFNTPILRQTFTSNFSISPEIKHIAYFHDNDTEVSILFEEPLKNNTRYFINISSDLQNIANNTMLEQYSYIFINNPSDITSEYNLYCNQDNTIQKLDTSKLNEDLVKNSILMIQFSNPIDINTIGSAISIIPPLDFSITKNTNNFSEISIIFEQTPDFNTEYTLKISDTIKDIYSKSLKSSEYRLMFNNPSSRPVYFLTMLIEKDNEIIPLTISKNYQNIYFSPDDYPTINNGTLNYIDYIFLFSISPNASQIKYFSAIENIKISSTLNSIDIQTDKIEIIKHSNLPQHLTEYISQTGNNLNENICAVKFHCKIQNKDNSGLINVSINSKLSDDINNTLNDSIALTINKR